MVSTEGAVALAGRAWPRCSGVAAGGAGCRGGDGGRDPSGGTWGESLPPELLLLLPSVPGLPTFPQWRASSTAHMHTPVHTHTRIELEVLCAWCIGDNFCRSCFMGPFSASLCCSCALVCGSRSQLVGRGQPELPTPLLLV